MCFHSSPLFVHEPKYGVARVRVLEARTGDHEQGFSQMGRAALEDAAGFGVECAGLEGPSVHACESQRRLFYVPFTSLPNQKWFQPAPAAASCHSACFVTRACGVVRSSTCAKRTPQWKGRLPKVSDNAIDWERYIEKQKSSVRCKVEHP